MAEWFLVLAMIGSYGAGGGASIPMQSKEACQAAASEMKEAGRKITLEPDFCVNTKTGEIVTF